MRLLPLCLFLLLNLSTTSPWADEADGKAFSVTGEQVNHPIPKGWKLAWMSGDPDGRYFAEYISSDEDINTWRTGYLIIERIPMPPVAVLEEIKKQNASLPEVLLHLFIDQAASSCGEKHEAMSRRVNFFNEIQFAVSGGFCEKYGSMAPYGEGAFVAFMQGQDHIFRIQYAWRPKSDVEKGQNLPWRISPSDAEKYLNAIKATTLCGGRNQPVCTIKYQ